LSMLMLYVNHFAIQAHCMVERAQSIVFALLNFVLKCAT